MSKTQLDFSSHRFFGFIWYEVGLNDPSKSLKAWLDYARASSLSKKLLRASVACADLHLY
jgi:hypothetical protein